MRKVLMLSVFLGVFGCEYHDSPVLNTLRTDFSASSGSTVTTGLPSFQVLVVSISDSRCPSDVVCIWGGIASVTFLIESNEFSLLIGQTKTFSVGQKNYELKLEDVTPYPNTKVANQEKKAVFILKPL
jgi:hypothetical protein